VLAGAGSLMGQNPMATEVVIRKLARDCQALRLRFLLRHSRLSRTLQAPKPSRVRTAGFGISVCLCCHHQTTRTLSHTSRFCSRRRGNRALDRHKQLESRDHFASSATARRLTLTYSRSATLTYSTSTAVPAPIFSSCAIVPGHRAVRASLIGFLVLLD
jgi:hypothetical protein